MRTNLECVILCGGLGTRIKSKFPNVPKILIPINKKPFLNYKLKNLSFINNFVFCTGKKSNQIENYCKKYLKNTKYSIVKEKEQLGTGGSLKNSLKYLSNNFFFFTYGDNFLLDIPYSKMILSSKNKKKSVMLIYKNKNLYDKSNIYFTKNNKIKYDKNNNPKANFIDYGFFLLKKDDIENIKLNKKKFDFGEILQKLIEKNKINFILSKKRFYEIGNFNSYNDFKKFITKKSL